MVAYLISMLGNELAWLGRYLPETPEALGSGLSTAHSPQSNISRVRLTGTCVSLCSAGKHHP